MRPFNCVEDLDFINVSQLLLDIGARYGRLPAGKLRAEDILVCANTVKRRIQTLADITRSEVTSRLAAAGAREELAFSLDLWTDRYRKQAYLGIKGTFYIVKRIDFVFTGMTAIFIESSFINTIDLRCRKFPYQKKRAKNLSQTTDKIPNEFGIQQYRKSATFVIDRGSNLKAALSHDQIIHCIVHRIHNILLETFACK